MHSITPEPHTSKSPVPALRLPSTALRPNASEVHIRQSATPEDDRVLSRLLSTQSLYKNAGISEAPSQAALLPSLRISRPRTSTISPLTARENSRLQQLSQTIDQSQPREQPKTDRPSTGLPNEEDYKRVLDRLNRLTSKNGVQRLSLQEGKSPPITLEESEWFFAKLPVKGFRTPLQISIKRSRGKLLVYTSKTVQEPNESSCDEKVRGDKVVVTDRGMRFKISTVYLGFHAVEVATFAVGIRFGTMKKTAYRNETHVNEPEKELFVTPIPVKVAKISPLKDFMAMNMRTSASTDKLTKIAERRSISEKRRLEAQNRHLEHIVLKREIAVMMINRHQIKQEERMRQQRLADEKEAKQTSERSWLRFISVAKFAIAVFSHYQARKEAIREEEIRNEMTARVQRRVRKFLHYKSPPMLAMLTFRSHLRLYVSVMGDLEQGKVAKFAMKGVENSYQTARITGIVSGFFTKATKRHRFDRMGHVWNQVFPLVIEEIIKKKGGKKAKKGKDNPTAAYFAIKPMRKAHILMQYYLEAKRRYVQEVNEFLKSGKTQAQPKFKYAPDRDTMVKLIEKAAKFEL